MWFSINIYNVSKPTVILYSRDLYTVDSRNCFTIVVLLISLSIHLTWHVFCLFNSIWGFSFFHQLWISDNLQVVTLAPLPGSNYKLIVGLYFFYCNSFDVIYQHIMARLCCIPQFISCNPFVCCWTGAVETCYLYLLQYIPMLDCSAWLTSTYSLGVGHKKDIKPKT